MINDVQWFVGIDWATQSHRVCLLDVEGRHVKERDFAHGGAGLTELRDWLLEKTAGAPGQIAVAIETPHGPVVEMLLDHGFQVFAINPKQLDRFRDRFTVAGAKDDSRDAHVLGSALRTDRHAFRRLVVDDPLVIELREWSRIADELQQERIRLANRVRQQLWRYYPQAVELTDDVADDWFLALWQQVPTPATAAKASEKTITRILKDHRIRRLDAATVLLTLRKTPLFVAPGTTEAAAAHIRNLAARLHLVNQQIKEAHRALDGLCAKIEAATENPSGQIREQHDVTILRSWPGIGRIVLATLLTEATEPLRRRDYHALRALAGTAPVTRRSGKQCFVIRRLACNKRLQNAVHHWSRVAIQRASGRPLIKLLKPGAGTRFIEKLAPAKSAMGLGGGREGIGNSGRVRLWAPNGHAGAASRCLLLRVERTCRSSGSTSEFDPGCVIHGQDPHRTWRPPNLRVSHARGNVWDCGELDQRSQSSLRERPMNLRVIFAACTIAVFGSSMMTFDALGQKQSLKEQLVGTWTLLSWVQKKGDGTKLDRGWHGT